MTLRLEVAPRPIGAAMLFLWLALSACASADPAAPEGVFLPSLTGAPPHYPSAAIGGTLVEDRGCLELRDPYLSAEFAPPSPGAVVLLLWPEGSRATRTEGGGLRVDAPDLPAAVTGRDLFIGGMFTSSLEDAEQKIGEPIPAACRVGLYWVATEQSLTPVGEEGSSRPSIASGYIRERSDITGSCSSTSQ